MMTGLTKTGPNLLQERRAAAEEERRLRAYFKSIQPWPLLIECAM